MKRARFNAVATARWKAAQLPERLRLNSLPWLVQSFLRPCTSLKSTNAGRGQPSFVQKRQRFLRPRPSFLRTIVFVAFRSGYGDRSLRLVILAARRRASIGAPDR